MKLTKYRAFYQGVMYADDRIRRDEYGDWIVVVETEDEQAKRISPGHYCGNCEPYYDDCRTVAIIMEYFGLHDNTKWNELSEEEQKAWLDSGKKKSNWKGREIYEGDILQYGSTLYSLEWSNIRAGFILQNTNLWSTVWKPNMARSMRIIGNIHQNTDLLPNTK